MSPVCFDNAIQSCDSVFGTVYRATDHQIPAIGRFEEEWNLKSQHSFAEVRVAVEGTIPVQVFDVQALWFRRAIPTGADVMGGQTFPAVLIRHHQREAPIREFSACTIHPPAFTRRRAYWCKVILIYLIGD